MSKWWQSSYFWLEFWHSARSITGRVERAQTSRCARWREKERKFCVPRGTARIRLLLETEARSLTAQIQFKAHKSKARPSLANIVAKINPAFISIHLTFGMRAGVAICNIWMGGASGVIGFHVQKHCDIANWKIIVIYHRKYFFFSRLHFDIYSSYVLTGIEWIKVSHIHWKKNEEMWESFFLCVLNLNVILNVLQNNHQRSQKASSAGESLSVLHGEALAMCFCV